MTWIEHLVPAVARLAAGLAGRQSSLVRAARPAYERLLGLLTQRRGLPWSVNGVPCRIDHRLRARLPRRYEPDAAAFLAARVRPGDICFDIGANVGAYVIQLAHWSRPNGRVIAFEPNPAAAELLERHVAWNGLAPRVEIVRAAVGTQEGAAVFHVAGADGRGRLNRPNPELAGQTMPLTVPVTSVDRFCTRHGLRPDWMLIDVEGLEIAALEGARVTLTTAPRPGVVVEMHPSAWPLSGTGRREAEQLLADLGLTAVPLSGQADPLGAHAQVYLAPAPST